MIKTRIDTAANYRSVWCNGKTLRFAIDPKKPITELQHPEFYDIKVTGHCEGGCAYCYMDSKPETHYTDIINKTKAFFAQVPKESLPYQVALVGGEPTTHPDFIELLKVLHEMGIFPNYTTNGMNLNYDILSATRKYCGGVAVSCHPHLIGAWQDAIYLFNAWKVKLNLHIIISDRESIDYFIEVYDTYKDNVDFFVLLPFGTQGRAEHKDIDWEYLVRQLPEDDRKIAYGAGVYKYLCGNDHAVQVSLYEPEIMSKFLDLRDMRVYKSSFDLDG